MFNIFKRKPIVRNDEPTDESMDLMCSYLEKRGLQSFTAEFGSIIYMASESYIAYLPPRYLTPLGVVRNELGGEAKYRRLSAAVDAAQAIDNEAVKQRMKAAL